MKWAENMRKLYEEEISFLPSYIENLESPLRMSYPSEELQERELMRNLAEVLVFFIQILTLIFKYCQENSVYNAFEKDIAVINIFFGESTALGDNIAWDIN